jgi:hypothetical protein
LVNGTLVADVDELNEQINRPGKLDVTFLFIQSEVSPHFDTGKITKFDMGVRDFFKTSPALPRSPRIAELAAMRKVIYDHAVRFKSHNPIQTTQDVFLRYCTRVSAASSKPKSLLHWSPYNLFPLSSKRV